jgi:hypothetical protein
MTTVIQDICGVLVVAASVPAVAFPILYTRWFPWWKTSLGRALFTKALGLALLVVLAVLRLFLDPEGVLFQSIRLAVLATVTIGLWFQLVEFTRVRQEVDEKRKRTALRLYLMDHGYFVGHYPGRDKPQPDQPADPTETRVADGLDEPIDPPVQDDDPEPSQRG